MRGVSRVTVYRHRALNITPRGLGRADARRARRAFIWFRRHPRMVPAAFAGAPTIGWFTRVTDSVGVQMHGSACPARENLDLRGERPPGGTWSWRGGLPSGADECVSYHHLTTLLTTMMPTVMFPDASTYPTRELVSRLVTPSACAYDQKVRGLNPFRRSAENNVQRRRASTKCHGSQGDSFFSISLMSYEVSTAARVRPP
jgi:hypothetical protein